MYYFKVFIRLMEYVISLLGITKKTSKILFLFLLLENFCDAVVLRCFRDVFHDVFVMLQKSGYICYLSILYLYLYFYFQVGDPLPLLHYIAIFF